MLFSKLKNGAAFIFQGIGYVKVSSIAAESDFSIAVFGGAEFVEV
jgi:hypothetical protein